MCKPYLELTVFININLGDPTHSCLLMSYWIPSTQLDNFRHTIRTNLTWTCIHRTVVRCFSSYDGLSTYAKDLLNYECVYDDV